MIFFFINNIIKIFLKDFKNNSENERRKQKREGKRIINIIRFLFQIFNNSIYI